MNNDNDKLKKYQEYFSEDLKATEDQLKIIDRLLEDIQKDIDSYKNAPNGRTNNMVKVETYRNLIQVVSQKQNIMKDRFSWKTKIMDLVFKDKDRESGSDETEIMKEMMEKIDMLKIESPYEHSITKETFEIELDENEEKMTNDEIMDMLKQKG